jgi:hypothetical protein
MSAGGLLTLTQPSGSRQVPGPRPAASQSLPQGQGQGQSWLDAYPPRTQAELAVYPTKVKAVQKWIADAVSAHALSKTRPDSYAPHVLVLCGCSGCGKSSLVEVLCRDLGVELTQWSDDMLEVGGSMGSTGAGYRGGGEYRDSSSAHSYAYNAATRRSLAGEIEEYARDCSFPSLELSLRGGGSAPARPAPVDTRPAARSSSTATTSLSAEVSAGAKLIMMHSPPFQNTSGKADTDMHGDLMLSFSAPVIVILSEVGGSDDMTYAADRALGLQASQKKR